MQHVACNNSPGNKSDDSVLFPGVLFLDDAAERRQESIPAYPGWRSNSHLHHRRKTTFCRGTSDRVWRSATELHPSLRQRWMAGFEPATSRLTVEVTHVFTTGKISILNKNIRGEADLRAEPRATSAKRNVGRTHRLAVWSTATEIKSSQRWKQNSKRGTIDPSVVVRRSGLKLRHSRCRRDLAESPSRRSCAQWVAGARTYGQAM